MRKLNGTYYIQPCSWSREAGGILAGQLQPVSVDQEGIRESLMAAVDLEPAEHDKEDQREEVCCSMYPPFLLCYKRKSFIQFNILSYKLVRTLVLKSCFGTTLGESKYTIIERCYQVHFLTWWVISLHDSLESDEWSMHHYFHTTRLFSLH